jgi:hypothetical protein
MLPVRDTAVGGCDRDLVLCARGAGGGGAWPGGGGGGGESLIDGEAVEGAGGERIPGGGELVAVGSWPRLTAQILRARLETAGIDVLAEWTDEASLVALAVPADQAEFARAVVHEIEVDDEVPDTSPFAYVARIEEHLSAVAELLEELRTRLDELEAGGGGS